MSPNPHRSRASGWLGRRTTRLKSLVVVGTATLGLAGLGIAAAGPAAADPATSYVMNGSDTIQDVMDGFAAAVGNGAIGSWDAVNPVTTNAHEIITPAKALAGGAFSNCSYTRPNGSTEGYNALTFSVFPSTTLAQIAGGVPPQAGCIDISRSSSAPGSINGTAGNPGSLDATGNLIYIPFAMDGVYGATGPTTAPTTTTTTKCVAATPGCTNGTITFTPTTTAIAQADMFTLANLTALYNCTAQTVNGVTYNPNNPAFAFTATSASPAVFTATGSAYAAGTTVQLTATSSGSLPGGFTAGTTYFVVNPSGTSFQLSLTAGGTAINSTTAGSGTVQAVTAGQQNIDLYVPQNGSGTLKFWAKAINFPIPPSGTLPTCDHQNVEAGPAAGVQVEEHDGSAYASDPLGYGPFSIAQWVAQLNGHNDRRHFAILRTIDNILPLTTSNTMNPGIENNFKREVYLVMQYDHAVDNVTAGGPFDSVLNGLFVSGTLSGGTTASSLCNHTFTIKSFGFLTLPQTGLPDNCGAFTNSLRVQETNTGPS